MDPAEEIHIYGNDLYILFPMFLDIFLLRDKNGSHDQYGNTLLMSSIIDYNEEFVRTIILTPGVDVNVGDKRGRTALHKACFLRRTYVVKLLLENGANVNALDKDEHTPLQFACQKYKVDLTEILSLLLKFGADVNLPNVNGCGPIEFAV